MSDALINSLQKRIDDLTGENASLKSENITRRKALKDARGSLEKLQAEHGTVAKERDEFKAKVDARPGELQGEVDRLNGLIRTRDHRDAFSAVRDFEVTGQDGKAAKFKLREGITVDALMKLTDYRAEGETPDARAVTTRLGDAMKAHPGLFELSAGETPNPAPGGASRFPVGSREAGPQGSRSVENSPPARDAAGWLAAQKATQKPGSPFGKIG